MWSDSVLNSATEYLSVVNLDKCGFDALNDNSDNSVQRYKSIYIWSIIGNINIEILVNIMYLELVSTLKIRFICIPD